MQSPSVLTVPKAAMQSPEVLARLDSRFTFWWQSQGPSRFCKLPAPNPLIVTRILICFFLVPNWFSLIHDPPALWVDGPPDIPTTTWRQGTLLRWPFASAQWLPELVEKVWNQYPLGARPSPPNKVGEVCHHQTRLPWHSLHSYIFCISFLGRKSSPSVQKRCLKPIRNTRP